MNDRLLMDLEDVVTLESNKFQSNMRKHILSTVVADMVIKNIPLGEGELSASYESEGIRKTIMNGIEKGFLPIIERGESSGKSTFLASLESAAAGKDFIGTISTEINKYVSYEADFRTNLVRNNAKNDKINFDGPWVKDVRESFEELEFTQSDIAAEYKTAIDQVISFEEENLIKDVQEMVEKSIKDVQEKTEITRIAMKEVGEVKQNLLEEQKAAEVDMEPEEAAEESDNSIGSLFSDKYPISKLAFKSKFDNGELSVEALIPGFIKTLGFEQDMDNKIETRLIVLSRSLSQEEDLANFAKYKDNVENAKVIGTEAFQNFYNSGLGVKRFIKVDKETISLAGKMKHYLDLSEESLGSYVEILMNTNPELVSTSEEAIHYSFEAFVIDQATKLIPGKIDASESVLAIEKRNNIVLEACYNTGELAPTMKRADEIHTALEGFSKINIKDCYTSEYLTSEIIRSAESVDSSILINLETESVRIKDMVKTIMGDEISEENLTIVDRLLEGKNTVSKESTNVFEDLVIKMGNKYVSTESSIPDEADSEKIYKTAKIFTTMVMTAETLGMIGQGDTNDLNKFLKTE